MSTTTFAQLKATREALMKMESEIRDDARNQLSSRKDKIISILAEMKEISDVSGVSMSDHADSIMYAVREHSNEYWNSSDC